MKRAPQGFAPPFIPIFFVLLMVIFGLVLRHHQTNNIATQTIYDNISRATKQSYPDMVMGRVGWPAEQGAGAPLKVSNFDFTINSESLPSLEFQGGMNSEQADPFTGHPECNENVQAELQPKHCRELQDSFNPTSSESARPIIEAEMAKDGFKKQAAATSKDANDIVTTTQRYTTGSRGCVYASRSYTVFSCYNPSSLRVAAEQLKPFVREYEHTNAATKTTYYGPYVIRSKNPGTIKASATPGYDIAEMIVINGTARKVAFFYNKQGGAWHFVDHTDDELGLSCTKLQQNPDIRKAFYNQICQSSNDAVRLDSSQPWDK